MLFQNLGENDLPFFISLKKYSNLAASNAFMLLLYLYVIFIKIYV